MILVVPLAYPDLRFEAEFNTCKPLVPINGIPLIKKAFDNLGFSYQNDFSKIIFLVSGYDEDTHNIKHKLKILFPYTNVNIIVVSQPTEGAACTVLLAKDHFTDEPLIIYLADILFSSNPPFTNQLKKATTSFLCCFESENPKYSYAQTNTENHVAAVAEKKAISSHASAGLYYYKRGDDFIYAAERMIGDPSKKVNDTFYVCPTYNELIERGDSISILPVTFDHGLGSPKEILDYTE